MDDAVQLCHYGESENRQERRVGRGLVRPSTTHCNALLVKTRAAPVSEFRREVIVTRGYCHENIMFINISPDVARTRASRASSESYCVFGALWGGTEVHQYLFLPRCDRHRRRRGGGESRCSRELLFRRWREERVRRRWRVATGRVDEEEEAKSHKKTYLSKKIKNKKYQKDNDNLLCAA